MNNMLKIFFLVLTCQIACISKVDQNKNSEKAQENSPSIIPTPAFERSPYIAIFEPADKPKFSLIGVHLKPESAVTEANYLDDVYSFVSGKESCEHAAIIGDMNLSCSYASQDEIDSLDIKQDSSYKWLIPDSADTNTAETVCAYDRIIVRGDSISTSPEGEVGSDVIADSDHFPIWAEISGFRVGSFNAKVFGETKSSDEAALQEMAELICSGDIMLIQEIVSESTTPTDLLLNKVTEVCPENQFKIALSDQTGSSSYKERFAYFIRTDKANLVDSYLFPQDEIITAENKPAETKETGAEAPNSTQSTDSPSTTEIPTTSESTTSKPNTDPACGIDPYWTPKMYCYATKDGVKKRVADACCPS